MKDARSTEITSTAPSPAVGTGVGVGPAASFDISDAARIALTAVTPSPDAGQVVEGPNQPA
jgi:hypothetical protein